MSQMMLQESIEGTKLLDVNHPRAQIIHKRIVEMIAVDSQPFSIVEDHAFSNLLKTIEPRYLLTSRKFFTENILPRIHAGVKSEVHSLLSSVSFFSFTTDIWNTSVGNNSLLSLTAHWLTDSLKKKICCPSC